VVAPLVRLARPTVAAQRTLAHLTGVKNAGVSQRLAGAHTLPASLSILLREASFSFLSGLSDRKAPEL